MIGNIGSSKFFRKSNIAFTLLIAILACLIIVVFNFQGRYLQKEALAEIQAELDQQSKLTQSTFERWLTQWSNEAKFLHSTPLIQGLARSTFNNGMDPDDNTSTAQWKKRLRRYLRPF